MYLLFPNSFERGPGAVLTATQTGRLTWDHLFFTILHFEFGYNNKKFPCNAQVETP